MSLCTGILSINNTSTRTLVTGTTCIRLSILPRISHDHNIYELYNDIEEIGEGEHAEDSEENDDGFFIFPSGYHTPVHATTRIDPYDLSWTGVELESKEPGSCFIG